MVQTILVPLDGSALAERALTHATGLARADGARLVIFHVRSAYGARGEQRVDPEKVAASLSQQGLAAEGLTYDQYVGGRGGVIAEAASDQGADLIVMSTHGRTGPGRWFYGSVAADVLHHATVPMLMIPARGDHPWPSGRPTTILVPLDGSHFAEQALEPARALAREGTLLLLHVVDPLISGYVAEEGDVDPVRQSVLDDAESYLRDVAARLRAAGAPVMTRVLVGAPGDVIAAEACAWGADLVAMATHGRTGLARLMLGSVAAGVLQRAETPVLFVRPVVSGAEAEGAETEIVEQSDTLDLVLDAREVELIEHALRHLLLPEHDPSLAEPSRALLDRLAPARSATSDRHGATLAMTSLNGHGASR